MIELDKGRDLDVKFQVVDQGDNSVDLSDADVIFDMRTKMGSKNIILEKTKDDGDISVDSEDNSICILDFDPEDTEDLKAKTYKYELMIELDSGEKYTAEIGDIEIKDVVRR